MTPAIARLPATMIPIVAVGPIRGAADVIARATSALLAAAASEFPHLCDVRLDVVGAEVHDGALQAAVCRIHRAAPAFVLKHPVVHPGHSGVLDRPAADALPELLRPVRVLRRELDVHD